MDSLTQIVLGAATAEFIAGKKIGNRAFLYGGILGTIPDLDVYIGKFYDIVTSNEIHRGFSHSFVFFILAAPLLGLLIRRLERKNGLTLVDAIKLSFWCLCTHALLDAFTNWGTQLLWPLEERFEIQSIFVIDPLYTLPFIYCLIRVFRLNRENPMRRKWNNRGLIISSSYLMLTLVLQAAAKHQFVARLGELNLDYTEVSVRPAPLNTILWNANISTTDGYYLGEYSFFDSQPITFDFYKRNSELIQGYENDQMIVRLKRMSNGWYTISESDGNLYFNDMRFGLLNEDTDNPEFVFRYLLNFENGKVTATEAESPGRSEPGKLLKRLWVRVQGN